jgi:N-methylhydantoinase B
VTQTESRSGARAARATLVDPITLEIVTNALVAVSREMGVSLQRAAYSTIIREARDFSCAVFAPDGRLVSQAAYVPIHLGSMDVALNAIRTRYPDDYRPGDAYLLNDPYSGAQHTPDVQIFTPVFVDGELVAWVGNVAHHIDVGGRVPGSVAGDNTEIYQEGLRVPPCLVYREGRLDPIFESILAANVREPEMTLGDLRAQLAANQLGVDRVSETFRRYGHATVAACIDQAIADTEQALRQRIARLPRGVVRGEDWIDDDGVGNGPFRVCVAIEPIGDELHVDLTGTSLQTAGPINSIISATRASVCYAIRAVLAPDLLSNQGAQVPVRVLAPEGTLVNPTFPSACGGRTVTCHRIVDAMMVALSELVPERVTAGSNGNMTASIGIVTDSSRSILFEIMPGGYGARPNLDGISGTDSHLSNCLNSPIEALELDHPVVFEQFEFRPDSGGAGRFQGGLGRIRELRLLEGRATLMLRGDQMLRGAIGLQGGRPSRPCRWVVNPGTAEERLLPSKVTTPIVAGDVVRRETAGGGGYGDPCERDPELIRNDLREEKVTPEWARTEYGFDPEH